MRNQPQHKRRHRRSNRTIFIALRVVHLRREPLPAILREPRFPPPPPSPPTPSRPRLLARRSRPFRFRLFRFLFSSHIVSLLSGGAREEPVSGVPCLPESRPSSIVRIPLSRGSRFSSIPKREVAFFKQRFNDIYSLQSL